MYKKLKPIKNIVDECEGLQQECKHAWASTNLVDAFNAVDNRKGHRRGVSQKEPKFTEALQPKLRLGHQGLVLQPQAFCVQGWDLLGPKIAVCQMWYHSRQFLVDGCFAVNLWPQTCPSLKINYNFGGKMYKFCLVFV